MRWSNVAIYPTSVWDRMMAPPKPTAIRPDITQLSQDQFKRSLARDLDALLNTRIGFPEEILRGHPYCTNSIVNFGLPDFASLCVSDSVDRKEICNRLQIAIERHEPRLAEVRVHLAVQTGTINRLDFVVTGRLCAGTNGERVRFDLMLEPSSQHYSVD